MDFINGLTNTTRHHVYKVSELNFKIKQLLEDNYPFLWISGEISNFRIPSSGHCYFTLKDKQSQISAVMFRTQAGSLKFNPEDGMSIVGLGRISVYEPRGAYQIIFEYIEPMGIGAMLIAFEKLKQKLSAEGLFDPQHKIGIPFLPKKISIISSPTGAAVRDFINIAQRRFANLPLEVVPASVQGDRSPSEIIHAIRLLNDLMATDVIVLARGGGSLEDLSAFNDEQVARAIYASKIPIVSAVGHETDYTLADFVADLRAPTPSAAAELCVPAKEELKNQLKQINQKLEISTNYLLKSLKKHLETIDSRIIHPHRRIQDWRMRLDDYSQRLVALTQQTIARRREQAAFRHGMLVQVSPDRSIDALKRNIASCNHTLFKSIDQTITAERNEVSKQTSMLDALNPMAILQRGYSITRTLPARSVVHSAGQVNVNQTLEVLLGKGNLSVTVNSRHLK